MINKKVTLFILLSVLLAMAGKLTGGFDDEESEQVQYEVAVQTEPLRDAETQEHMLAEVTDKPEGEKIQPMIQAINARLHESYYRFYLALAILISSPLSLFVTLKFLPKTEKSTDEIVTIAGLVMVIHGTLFIVTATISSEALTASIGLLAAVGGYVLRGATSEKSNKT